MRRMREKRAFFEEQRDTRYSVKIRPGAKKCFCRRSQYRPLGGKESAGLPDFFGNSEKRAALFVSDFLLLSTDSATFFFVRSAV